MSAWGPELHVRLDVETTNPLNGSQGRTKGAQMAKAAQRKALRQKAFEQCAWQTQAPALRDILLDLRLGTIEVEVVRLSPRELDQHDGLGAALKPIIDGISDFLQMKDNDKQLVWVLKQRKGRVRECGIEITMSRAQATP